MLNCSSTCLCPCPAKSWNGCEGWFHHLEQRLHKQMTAGCVGVPLMAISSYWNDTHPSFLTTFALRATRELSANVFVVSRVAAKRVMTKWMIDGTLTGLFNDLRAYCSVIPKQVLPKSRSSSGRIWVPKSARSGTGWIWTSQVRYKPRMNTNEHTNEQTNQQTWLIAISLGGGINNNNFMDIFICSVSVK